MSPHPRLTPLDASFLEVESPTAHMHVGWVALFDRPAGGVSFEQLRDHVASRLQRAPRYRQKLASVPLGIADPVWVDDERFHIERHVFHATAPDIGDIADAVFSVPLERDRPLWELWIADQLDDGRVGVVGKAHHCMVDGIAAVELAALLLDPEPSPPELESDDWRPTPEPGRLDLLATGLADRAREQLDILRMPTRLLRSPAKLVDAAGVADRAVRALATSVRPAPQVGALNDPISAHRMLVRMRRPLDDLREIRSRHGTTVNDVVLAAAAGGVGRFLQERGDVPIRLKAMVPVSVREDENGGALGNQISFMFVDLPCDEPDPLARLFDVSRATSECKQAGEPEGAHSILQAFGLVPHTIQHMLSRLVASPRTFNLVVSNIPGPVEPLYMRGCELREAYPVVPLADNHGLSIGFTTIRNEGCFGIYADRESLPDAPLLAQDIGDAIDELLERPASVGGRRKAKPPTPPRQPVPA